MEQYFAIKKQFEDAILFFQVGDFYELFFDDARKAAPILGVALTQRGTHQGNPIPLCGVPLHALNHYLTKLIKAGLHVVIADQLEPARPGIVVKRGVTRVLTPGTLTDTNLLQEKHTSYLCSLYCTEGVGGFVVLELLTGQLLATTFSLLDSRSLETQLERFAPDEIIVGGPSHARWRNWLGKSGYVLSCPLSAAQEVSVPSWLAVTQSTAPHLGAHASTAHHAIEQLYAYVNKNQPQALTLCKKVNLYKADDFLILDGATIRNLELVHNMQDGSAKNTVFAVLDQASTSMGSRLIKKWLLSPLININAINHRLDAVQALVSSITNTQNLTDLLKEIGDLERVLGRIALKRAQLQDYLHLARALAVLGKINAELAKLPNGALLDRLLEHTIPLETLFELLESALNNDPNKDWLIKAGFDHKLEQLRHALDHAQDTVLALERAEQERTRINSLKIRYNNIAGYYVEITKTNLHLVPAHYERQQTLTNVERFTIPDLRAIELQLERAKSEISTIENSIYERIKSEVETQLGVLRQRAQALATLDALIGFALTAYDHNYCRPVFAPMGLHRASPEEESSPCVLTITQGTHPVVGHALGTSFIPNNTTLSPQERVVILTGPNMGGKSTYLRQIAQICLMAQCGSFIPAQSATLPILDRIFTRVGAGDNVAEGKSTFLIEMEETAAICTQATEKSLVILDEVGRGTSTYDGMAIAQAVVEHLYHSVGCFCLFATHYHELTTLDNLPGIVNYHAACAQKDDKILFLHIIIKGAAQGSFGIHVAQLAQLPAPIIARAQELLEHFTQEQQEPICLPAQRVVPQNNTCTACKKVCEKLAQINPDELSPRQAHELVYALKNEHTKNQ